MDWIVLLLFLLSIASFILFLVGLINPALSLKFLKHIPPENYTRGKVTKYYMGSAIFLFILFVVGVEKTKVKTGSAKIEITPTVAIQASPTIKQPTETPIPTVSNITPTENPLTPKPTEDCSKYSGSDRTFCFQFQQAQEEGEALKHPLKAKIRYDNYGIYITNTENSEWKQCTVIPDYLDNAADNYVSDEFVVNPGQTTTVSWANLANNENVRFNYYQIKPYSINLDCTVNEETHRSIFSL